MKFISLFIGFQDLCLIFNSVNLICSPSHREVSGFFPGGTLLALPGSNTEGQHGFEDISQPHPAIFVFIRTIRRQPHIWPFALINY